MAYATLVELRDWVGIPAADTADDSKLTLALAAAEEQVNRFTGRQFTAETAGEVRYYTALDAGRVYVDPFATTTDLAVATDADGDGTYETTMTVDVGYRLAPYNAVAVGAPWTSLVALSGHTFPTRDRGVKVTARWGYGAVPSSVKQATLIQAAFLWARKDTRFGVAGSPEFGNELRVESALDRTAQALLRPYRAMWAVV